jgi:formylglycine-generating enzyme required for sulfatase activity/predicted Ser/Thr protein kinase
MILLKPGDRVEDFVIERELGRGGMGCVYLARGKFRQVALKVLLPDLLDEEGEARFEREISNLIRLEGLAGIPIVYQHGTRPMPFVAMQFLEGRELGKYYDELRDLPDAERFERLGKTLADTCRIVDAAHKKNVVHRDIKPANVLVTNAGDRPFVLDFGIAKCLQDTRLTRGAQAPGTAPYQAPEQVDEDLAIEGRDHLIDVWAMGVVMYRLLTREFPFNSKSVFNLQKLILDGEPKLPRSLNPAIPPALEDLIVDCLAKPLDKRPQTMGEIADRLRAIFPSTRPSSRVPSMFRPAEAPVVWYDVVAQAPDPAAVTSEEWRKKIEACGLPWKVADRATGIEHVLVPPHDYVRGSPPDAEGEPDERPAHRVKLTRAFYLGVHPVTQEQFQKLTGKNPSKFAGEGSRPVERVSYADAVGFAVKAGLRLPTEAEWEAACRAGATGVRYAPADQAGFFAGNSGNSTQPVKRKAPSPLGFYDLLGNVWEWCSDWYDAGEYARAVGGATDPRGPDRGEHRVIRGGAWNFPEKTLRAATRGRWRPEKADAFIGFRTARTP